MVGYLKKKFTTTYKLYYDTWCIGPCSRHTEKYFHLISVFLHAKELCPQHDHGLLGLKWRLTRKLSSSNYIQRPDNFQCFLLHRLIFFCFFCFWLRIKLTPKSLVDMELIKNNFIASQNKYLVFIFTCKKCRRNMFKYK